ncbi:ABC transporter permease [candidate division WOR-3 bacterium]|uniref:ABC transporter permease n=1 Tax=candidate division WOR-3 bacterium TaxID=2052148 RepID=A0A938BU79_UNCW3|nr:ABC transporter permease [candidate division WOR-3 bacterium]
MAGPLVLLLLWAAVSYTGLANRVLLPSPSDVFRAVVQIVRTMSFWQDLAATLYRLVAGFGPAAVLGTAIGLALGASRKASDSLEFVIDFFRSVPASALFPAFMLFLGIGDTAKVSVVTFSCLLVIILYTIYGVRNCSEHRKRVAKVLRAGRMATFAKVILPDSLPHIFAGIRISVSIALVLVVVTEMFIGTKHGVGRLIYDSQLMFRVPTMYGAILITGVLGYAINKGFVALETRVLHWTGK